MTQERDEAIAKVYEELGPVRQKFCRDTRVVIMISHSLRDVLVKKWAYQSQN